MAWQQLRIATREQDCALFEKILEELGALSITFTDGADQPIYEPPLETTPLWQSTHIVGLFDEEANLGSSKQLFEAEIDPSIPWTLTLERLEDQVWERVWLDDFKPVEFSNNFWVCSSQHQVPEQAKKANARILSLDPGLAFGTGTHPTTALCLEWLSKQDLSKQDITDFGCGSGILAIAALILGAAKADCIDIDPQALIATEDNALKNNVSDKVQLFNADDYPTDQKDLVLANILAEPLMSLSGQISALVKPAGKLLLSGILQEQAEQVMQYYEEQFIFDEPLIKDNWGCLCGTKKS